MSTGYAKRTLVAAFVVALAACDATPPSPQPSQAVVEDGTRVQADRGMVWLLNGKGLFLQDPRTSQRVAIPLPDWQWAAEPYACMPDLALGPKGELIVTSNVLPKIWRVDAETLAVTVHALELDADNGKDVGFAGVVYSALSPAYFAVSQLHGSLWMIDPSLQRASKIALEDLADSSVEVETAFIRATCASTAPRS
jgi:hypothetical protein